jgi:hypothetical protein
MVNDRTIKLICNAFNVREDWLRIGQGEIYEEGNKDSKHTKLIALFDNLHPKYQEYIIKSINYFLELQTTL